MKKTKQILINNNKTKIKIKKKKLNYLNWMKWKITKKEKLFLI